VLRVGINLFWLAFMVDGGMSLVDELSGGVSRLSLLRSVMGFLVLLASLVLAGVIVFTPRAPKRVLLPLIGFLWWSGPGVAFPLGVFGASSPGVWVALAQLLLGMGVFMVCGERARLPFAVHSERKAFSWRHSLVFAPVVFFGALVFATISVCAGLVTEIEQYSGGYIRVRPDGIYLLERRFELGLQEVRLTGMIHVAEQEFYSGILSDSDPELPSAVLVEGVTDHRGLLSRGGLRFTRLAKLLNVASQDESSFAEDVAKGMDRENPGERSISQDSEVSPADPQNPPVAIGVIDFRHADVDVESFHPSTIAFLVTIVGLLQSEDPKQILHALIDPASPLRDGEAQSQVMNDILHARNQTLVAEIQLSLKTYRRIIVPWGAMHLRDVEAWLRTQNFVQSGEVERKALAFW
jgi:hypothetical protein